MALTSHFFRYYTFFVIFFSVLFYSCSEKDEGGVAPPVERTVPFDISLFAEKNGAIFQIDVLGIADENEVTNLSQTIGVPIDFKEVHTHKTKITFFKKDGGNYAFWQKDLSTGSSLSRSPMCEQVEEESWSFPETNGDKLALITVISPANNQWESYLKVYNPATDSCSRFFISNIYVQSGFHARLHKEQLYLYTPEENGIAHSLTVINLNSGEQVEKLTFETAFQATMSEEELYILFPNGNYKMYRINDLSLLEEGQTGNQLLFKNAGIYETIFKGSKMIFDYPYAQPARMASAPAIYDWETKEITHGGDLYLADALDELQNQNAQALAYTALKVNLDANLLVAGYKVLGEDDKGGVIYFNFKGEMLMNLPLDYVPFKIIIRE